MEFCKRCGGEKRNDSELCFKCSEEFQKYMKTHPLSTYTDITQMRKESDERWNNFIHSTPIKSGRKSSKSSKNALTY